MFTLTIEAATAEELRQKIADAQPKGGSPLAVFTPEQLLEELRARMRPQGLVVNVVQFAEVEEEDKPAPEATASETDPPKTRKPREPKATAKPVDAPPLAVQPNTATAQAMAEDKAAAESVGTPTREQMIRALDAYAKGAGGQAGARTLMTKHGGPRLADIPTDKWAVLLTELSAAPAGEQVAA